MGVVGAFTGGFPMPLEVRVHLNTLFSLFTAAGR